MSDTIRMIFLCATGPGAYTGPPRFRGFLQRYAVFRSMPIMSSGDFSIHIEECDEFDDGMPISSLPDEVTSIDDLDCECWSGFESLDEI